MRIVLDLQAIQAPANRSRGIGRAYRSLVREIILQSVGHEVLVLISGLLSDYVEDIWDQLYDILPVENFHVWHGVAEASWHQAAQNGVSAYCRQINTILYRAYLVELNPDVVLFGNFCDGYDDSCLLPVPTGGCKVPLVMICHDLIPLVYPELYDDRSGHGFVDFYRLQLAYLKTADHVLVFSNSVRDDVTRLLQYPSSDITMTGMGFTSLSAPMLTGAQVQDVCHKYNIKKPFILYVSAQDPRKNHVGVIEAFARLEPRLRDTYQIVFAGSSFADQGRLYDAVRDNDLPQSVLSIAIHPTDEDLQTLYKLAHLGIFASLYEGFGLGILESMAIGLPVIASNTSAMPEVMGREDALFDPTDVADMAGKITQALTDQEFRADLTRFGLDHIGNWDWATCAERAIAALTHVHANAGPRETASSLAVRQWAIERVMSQPNQDVPAATVTTILANTATAITLTYPMPPQVARDRLFVDVSEFVHYDYNTGIQRVIKSVVIEMARQLKDVELALVYSHSDSIGYYYARNLQSHLLDGRRRQPFEQESTERVEFGEHDILFHCELTMPQVIRQRFYLQSLRRVGVRVMFLVHDLIPINYSFHEGHHSKSTMLRWLSCLLQGDKLISNSHATQTDIQRCVVDYSLSHQPELELDWCHLGGDFHNYTHHDVVKRIATSQVVDAFHEEQISGLRGKINFLMVGTIEPRKSHADMLRTLQILWDKGADVNLVVVGKMGWLDDKQMHYVRHHREIGHRFFLFNDLSDVQLNEVYGLATCLLYFSKVEGFGLPLIEAAQHGLPIIVRDAAVFREICGEHAFYFPDNLSPNEIAPYIERWLALYEEGKHPTSVGMPWLTWRDSVRNLIGKIFDSPDAKKRLAEGDAYPPDAHPARAAGGIR